MNDHAAPRGGTPVFTTSWDPEHLDFPADADFQTGIGDWILRGELDDPADALMGGKPAPRIWMLLHQPGEGRLAAVTALALARELMGRDQTVLVLDCDEDQALLAGWADRRDQEGWIDLARYGASLLTCGTRLPFPGRQGLLLGPGSYRPVDAQPAEIEQLLTGLRRQADDILVCCPIGDIGRTWAQQADLRLLCWDRTTGTRERIDSLAEGLNRAATPLTGVVAFGEEATDPGPEDADPLAAPTGTDPKQETDQGSPEADAEIDRATERLAPENAQSRDADVYARKRGTSRVFWWIALGAIVLIAASFWYYQQYVMVEPLDGGQVVAQQEDNPQAAAESGGQPGSATATESGEAVGANAPGDGAEDLAASNPPDGNETSGGISGATQTVADGTGRDSAVQEPEIAAEPPAQDAAPATEPAPGPESQPESDPGRPGFQMDPYLVTVGEDGWALHIYSFPDSQTAGRELEILHRRGFQTAERTVQIKDKGRWERIYLGSFSSKAEAQEALPLLLKKLGEDWGRPTRF